MIPGLGNHLWQSTLFAIVVGLLTLLLRKNYARVRYRLWLAASVKFLLPFSLLIEIGQHLAWSRESAGTRAGLYFAMEGVSQPFSQGTMATISRSTSSTVFLSLIHLLPALLATVWFCGFLVVLSVWYASWRRISEAKREAAPLREGREVEALRRLEHVGLRGTRIEISLSRASLEPGIFGIVRPVLIWPEGISERLEDAHLEAVLAHELWHVRRRDNLAAAIHMVVEAIFWFHPLVWWLGAQLVEERELACDEEVLELGGERQVYAESILKVCEFCVGSPLACVSGVTGADLKKRIVHIMNQRVVRKLDFSRKLLLCAAGLVAVTVPIVFGLINATPRRAQSQAETTAAITPAYEVIKIKRNKSDGGMVGFFTTPNGLSAVGVTLQTVIEHAYGVEGHQISQAPSWLNSEKFDIETKVGSSVADDLRMLSPDQRNLELRRMLQRLLADRFKLSLHRETKELPIYSLVVAENGPRLQEAKPGDTYPNGIRGPDGRPAGPHMEIVELGRGLTAQALSMTEMAQLLTRQLGRTVLDKTGLTGNYDFTLHWTPEGQAPIVNGTESARPDNGSQSSPESSEAPMFTALREQLGLKLESQTAPLVVLVIDHAESPTEN